MLLMSFSELFINRCTLFGVGWAPKMWDIALLDPGALAVDRGVVHYLDHTQNEMSNAWKNINGTQTDVFERLICEK